MKQKRVNFAENDRDLESLVLGELGMSTAFIQHETHLTPGQIAYRLRLRGVRRSDYRNGENWGAKLVLRQAPIVRAHLRGKEDHE